jgi:hypothetical protein
MNLLLRTNEYEIEVDEEEEDQIDKELLYSIFLAQSGLGEIGVQKIDRFQRMPIDTMFSLARKNTLFEFKFFDLHSYDQFKASRPDYNTINFGATIAAAVPWMPTVTVHQGKGGDSGRGRE